MEELKPDLEDEPALFIGREDELIEFIEDDGEGGILEPAFGDFNIGLCMVEDDEVADEGEGLEEFRDDPEPFFAAFLRLLS